MFRIKTNRERSFEYLIAAGWSEGSLNRTADEFQTYTKRAAEEFNAPLELVGTKIQTRSVAVRATRGE